MDNQKLTSIELHLPERHGLQGITILGTDIQTVYMADYLDFESIKNAIKFHYPRCVFYFWKGIKVYLK